MEVGQPSGTALSAALLRAVHLVCDGEPPILRDDLAAGLCGVQDPARLQALLARMRTEATTVVGAAQADTVLRAVRAAVLTRTRYTEEAVRAALPRGLTQYVILGAGLDTFAYRHRDLAATLHVFEVDHPTTQAWKRARLQALQIPLPAHLTFIPVDFERQSLMEALIIGGYRPEVPALFSLLGVTQYLTADAVWATLRHVATASTGSEVVCGYLVPPSSLDTDNQRVLTFLQAITATRGEPIRTFFTPDAVASGLSALGFSEIRDIGSDGVLAQYTHGRTDGLQTPQTHRLVHARAGTARA
ncbi:MAG: class I SAM-dependent methyltransferase, partial [Deltaproteobacteria bacterium]|nr:class I SAM-dependent methyltransferase [Deltaproteobacteria bacterium]